MPRLSCFTPCGLLRCSSAPSNAERIYKSIVRTAGAGKGPDLTPGTYAEARIYANAITLACADRSLEYAGEQGDVNKVTLGIRNLEKSYGIVADTTLPPRARRPLLKLRAKRVRGARRESVVDALRTALGSDFLAYRTTQASERYVFPASVDMATTRFANPLPGGIAPKFLKTIDPIVNLGAPLWVRYENLRDDEGELRLLKGDVVAIDTGNTSEVERITVAAVSDPTTDLGVREFQATFAYAHDEGSPVTTQPRPVQFSTVRYALVVVVAAAAIDPAKRALVDDVMSRYTRVVDQWAIVQPTSPGDLTVGPLVLPSPIGAVPIGTFDFTPDP